MEAIKKYMNNNGLEAITGETSIFIKPGYGFRICQGLITNFHQPASTLILLVAALVGKDWRTIYDEALKNDYRFLSYGDSSLLLP
jgi:S-adenosylmethionine:tRNA ribosyltransferase-isomerase